MLHILSLIDGAGEGLKDNQSEVRKLSLIICDVSVTSTHSKIRLNESLSLCQLCIHIHIC